MTVETLLTPESRLDIAAANSLHVESLYEEGKLSAEDVVIRERSSPYVDYVWCAQPGLSEDLCRRMRNVLLELDPLKPRTRPSSRSSSAAATCPRA